MRPAGLVAVCNEVVRGDRTRIVECGSGVSTVVLAPAARTRRRLGRAVEHDGAWAALVGDVVRREALDRVARVVHAPLEGDPQWYPPAALDAASATSEAASTPLSKCANLLALAGNDGLPSSQVCGVYGMPQSLIDRCSIGVQSAHGYAGGTNKHRHPDPPKFLTSPLVTLTKTLCSHALRRSWRAVSEASCALRILMQRHLPLGYRPVSEARCVRGLFLEPAVADCRSRVQAGGACVRCVLGGRLGPRACRPSSWAPSHRGGALARPGPRRAARAYLAVPGVYCNPEGVFPRRAKDDGSRAPTASTQAVLDVTTTKADAATTWGCLHRSAGSGSWTCSGCGALHLRRRIGVWMRETTPRTLIETYAGLRGSVQATSVLTPCLPSRVTANWSPLGSCLPLG
jgi:hypothetical protein